MKDPQAKMFPENTHGMQESVITSILLTSEFLIFSNDVCKIYNHFFTQKPKKNYMYSI